MKIQIKRSSLGKNINSLLPSSCLPSVSMIYAQRPFSSYSSTQVQNYIVRWNNKLVLDVDMPVMGGVEATCILISMLPNVKIIGLSLHEIPTVKERMLMAGASAYLSKDEASDKLCAAIQKEGAQISNLL